MISKTYKEKIQQVEQLHRLGDDCWDELQYSKAEKFYQYAMEVSEQINNLSLIIREKFCFATMQRMQGKHELALATYTELLETIYNPILSQDLQEDDFWYLEGAFRNLIEVGRFLPEIKLIDMEKLIDRGLNWLISIGKQHWSAGLYLQRATLWKEQGRQEEALIEMERALGLSYRYSGVPSYTLGTHLLCLGDLLTEMNRVKEAKPYYLNVADGNSFDAHDRWRAWQGLSEIAVKNDNFSEAETCALKSLELAWGIESLEPIRNAYDLIGTIYYRQNQLTLCMEAKVQAWHYARQLGEVSGIYDIYRDMAKIRIYQAKQGNPHRYIPKARRWLQWALPLAVRLDRQVGLTNRQDKIREKQAECDAILRDSATGDN